MQQPSGGEETVANIGSKTVVALDDPEGAVALYFMFGLLLSAKSGRTDAIGVGSVKSFDICLGSHSDMFGKMLLRQKLRECHIGRSRQIFEQIEGFTEKSAVAEFAVFETDEFARALVKSETGFADEIEEFWRPSVDEFCAEFNRQICG